MKLAGFDVIPIAYFRLREAPERRTLLIIQRQQPRQRCRHQRLGGAAGAIVAFDGDAEAEFGQRAAIDALGAGFDENARAEELHDLGTEPTGAGDMPWLLRTGLAQPRGGTGACGQKTVPGAEFGKAAGKTFDPRNLASETFIGISEIPRVLRGAVNGYLKRSGVRATPRFEIDNFAMAMSLVTSERGVALLPISIEDYLPPSIVSRRLKGEQPTVDLMIGYRKGNSSPILKTFLSRIDGLIGVAVGSGAGRQRL